MLDPGSPRGATLAAPRYDAIPNDYQIPRPEKRLQRAWSPDDRGAMGWPELPVHAIQARAVARGLLRREVDEISHVGIDEKSFLTGHKYASLMVDIDGERVLDVVEGRTLEAANELWSRLPEDVRHGIDAVAMDMWDAFITSTKANAPQADIVHDKFHISKYLNTAVDKVRRAEHKVSMKDGDETLKGAKYLFLKRPENMTENERERFGALRMDNLKAG